MQERQSFQDSIRQNEDFQRLLKRIALTEGFQGIVVTCEMLRVANAIVDIVESDVPALREESIHVVRLEPYRAHKNILQPIPFDLLVDQVLAPLVHPPAEGRGSSVVTMVDASRSMPQDDGAWEQLFLRMNERRNAIMRALSSVLLFIFPKRYVILFARCAPDFWSVCSASIFVPTPQIEEEPWFIPPAEAIVTLDELRNEGAFRTTESIEEIEKVVAVLHAQLERAPQDTATEDALHVWLGRLAEAAKERNLMDVAVSAQREIVERLRKRLAQDPANSRVQLQYVVQLMQLGSLQSPNDTAQQYLDEGIDLVRRSWIEGTTNPVTLAMAASALDFRGVVHSKHADWKAARADFEETRRLTQQLVATNPAHIGWQIALAGSTVQLAHAHLRLGDVDAATNTFTESLAYWRQASSRGAEHWTVSYGITQSLKGLGDAFAVKNALEDALAHYAEALETARQALQGHPDNLQLQRFLFDITAGIINIHIQRNDFDRASAEAAEALDSAQRWLITNPEDMLVRRPMAIFLIASGLASHTHNRSAEALAHYRSALSVLEPLITGTSPDPASVKLAQEMRALLEVPETPT